MNNVCLPRWEKMYSTSPSLSRVQVLVDPSYGIPILSHQSP